MLDTRMPPISTRPRRPYTSARPEARPAPAPRLQGRQRAEREHARKDRTVKAQAARAQTAREQAVSEPMRRSLPSARTSRLARSEMRLMGLATGCTAAVCALLLLYLAAYAHVTQLGIAQSQARMQLRHNQIRNALLQARRNALESPQRIETAAAAQGMTLRGAVPVNYIPAQTQIVNTQTAQTTQPVDAPDWEQGRSGDTTENSGAAAPGNH